MRRDSKRLNQEGGHINHRGYLTMNGFALSAVCIAQRGDDGNVSIQLMTNKILDHPHHRFPFGVGEGENGCNKNQ